MRAGAVLCAASLALAGCSSSDYSHARKTRFERPYLGGAASVPDGEPPRSGGGAEPTALDLVAFFGFFALAFTHGIDHVGPLPQSFPSSSDR